MDMVYGLSRKTSGATVAATACILWRPAPNGIDPAKLADHVIRARVYAIKFRVAAASAPSGCSVATRGLPSLVVVMLRGALLSIASSLVDSSLHRH
uniref:Uncharacterized protein n=1 Tax=Oryza punctata TaxID=4537 RepID=A0A0E0LIN7_ORYPU